VLRAAVSGLYNKDAVLLGMELRHDATSAHTFKVGEAVPPLSTPTGSTLERARDRGTLRVGYFDDSLPYAFFNARNDLVGFDVDMALALGKDLGLAVEFVPVGRDIFRHGLDGSRCDLVMSGAAITMERAFEVQFSASYLDETIALVVPDHRAAAFTEWSSIRAMGPLRIGVPRAPYYVRRLREELRDVEIVEIDGLDEMFVRRDPPIDAFVMTAERGSAYTLLHPAYSVVIPRSRPFKVPLGYVIAGRDVAMTAMVNTWIEQKRKDGTIADLFSYWILGQNSAPPRPRWSIMRNVFGWT
jgi:ABC-type amino acid transport substrate-binding protein